MREEKDNPIARIGKRGGDSDLIPEDDILLLGKRGRPPGLTSGKSALPEEIGGV